ncbi:hypothetical protein [Lactococcus allomyrinae]|nr:hypothetical protein [Lactococcus allomyrinae]
MTDIKVSYFVADTDSAVMGKLKAALGEVTQKRDSLRLEVSEIKELKNEI